MKFRSDIELTVSDSTSMHKAIIGPEWRPLPPVLHGAAISAGAEVDKSQFQAEPVKTEAGEGAAGQHDEASVIRNAIEALLKKNDDNDFTNDGAPKTAAVKAQTGMNHSKSDIVAVWTQMQAEAAEAADEAEAE